MSRFAVSDDTTIYDQPTDDQRVAEQQREDDWNKLVAQMQVLHAEYLRSWPTVVQDLQRQLANPENGGIFASFASEYGWAETIAVLSRAMRDAGDCS